MNIKRTPLLLLILFVSLTIIGCTELPAAAPSQSAAPQSASQSGSVMLLDESGNRILLETDSDNHAMIQIFSEQGWGNAAIDLPNAAYPNQITLRFHLSGLEQLMVEHNGITREISISSTSDFAVRQSLTNAAGTTELAVTSPDWALAGLVEIGGTPAPFIDVTMPTSFVEQQISNFTIQWIDFYR